MKKKLTNIYSELGLNIDNNQILISLLDKLNLIDETIRQQFELFHMDFLLGLNELKEFDNKSFKRYISKINETKGNLNFWGERFEIFMHSKLIKANPELITNLKRGKDGNEPDLVFKYKDITLGLELTTLKFIKPPKSKDIILSKITDKILEKNNRPYSNDNCVLIIDITNIIAYEKSLNIKSILKEKFSGLSYSGKDIKFGMVILCNSVFAQNKDQALTHRLEPRFGFVNETKNMNKELKGFLNILFDNFKHNSDYNHKYYHLNI